MRAVIAERPTKCHICKDQVEPGSQRLDDIVKVPSKSADSEPHFIRLHYHVNCYKKRLDDPKFYILPKRRTGGGYPPLDISDEDKKKRRGVLTRMAELFRYYLPRLNLQTPPNELTWDDVQKFGNFITRFRQLKRELQKLGGVPTKYEQYDIESLSQKFPGNIFIQIEPENNQPNLAGDQPIGTGNTTLTGLKNDLINGDCPSCGSVVANGHCVSCEFILTV